MCIPQVPFAPWLLLLTIIMTLFFSKHCDIRMSLRWSAFSASFHIRALDHKMSSALRFPWLYSSGQAWPQWQGDMFASHGHGRALFFSSKGTGIWPSTLCLYYHLPFLWRESERVQVTAPHCLTGLDLDHCLSDFWSFPIPFPVPVSLSLSMSLSFSLWWDVIL